MRWAFAQGRFYKRSYEALRMTLLARDPSYEALRMTLLVRGCSYGTARPIAMKTYIRNTDVTRRQDSDMGMRYYLERLTPGSPSLALLLPRRGIGFGERLLSASQGYFTLHYFRQADDSRVSLLPGLFSYDQIRGVATLSYARKPYAGAARVTFYRVMWPSPPT